MIRKYKFTVHPGEHVRIGVRGEVTKWQDHTARATEDYKRGIERPRRPWGRCTCEAKDRWKAGVDRSYGEGRYVRGIKRSGRKKWQTKTLLKGPTRWSQGVIDAGDDYGKGFAPYHARFPSIFLPKRYPRGDPRNIERVKVICTEYGRVKTGKAEAGKVTCPEK